MPDDAETTLILAGDIWNGTNFIIHGEDSWIANVAQHFKQVLIVLGNHDYWINDKYITIKDGARTCNNLLAHLGIMNVKVLDCDIFEDGDVMFVGCTLWTDMNKGEPLAMFNMPRFMIDDGKSVYDEGPNGAWSRFTSEKWVETHKKHRDYLKIILEQNRHKKIVVITHHIPLTFLHDPAYKDHHANCYYASDLSDLILDSNIKLWFYGHTHYQNETLFGETLLVNNCVGYRGQQMQARGLVKHKAFEL
jgi:predicted phosphohydrolase